MANKGFLAAAQGLPAADDDIDPATPNASRPARRRDRGNDSKSAVQSERAKAVVSDSEKAADERRTSASVVDDEQASGQGSEPETEKDSDSASSSAGISAVEYDSLPDSGQAIGSADMIDGEADSAAAVKSAAAEDSRSDRENAGGRPSRQRTARQTAAAPASRTASVSAVRKDGGKPRRRGRPRGPQRVATTVRLLKDFDDSMTEVCAAADVGPQDVIDAAVGFWLVEHGWIEADEVPAHAAAIMAELERQQPGQRS